MPQMEWLWLGLLIVFAVVEASTASLVSIWFVGGSLTALIAAVCGADIWLQILLFFAVSGTLLAILRPLARKHIAARKVATNVDSNIGKDAVVLETIDNLNAKGSVKIGAVVWTARSVDDSHIPEGAVVRVVRIEGVKALVEPK